jgi:glucose-1-phosphate thymidylyltransferase
MIGVILSGGLGTRMGYYTHRITNKHLCYVYNRPMMDYPLLSLVEAGIDEVVIVTGGRHSGDTMDYLGNGREFGLKSLNYARQYGEGGIGDALRCAKPFAEGKPVCVILGDNLFEDDLTDFVKDYKGGGKVLLKEVTDPSAYGVATVVDGKITKIVEKPKNPESNLAIVGAYIFDKDVFDIIKTLKPSNRGELEVTDIIQHYHDQQNLNWGLLKGYWTDLGSPETLLNGANFIHANKDKYKERFDKHFSLDLALPFSKTKAEGLIEKNSEEIKDELKKHIKKLDKWRV